MKLSAYEMNMQYTRTELNYEMNISKVSNSDETKLLEEEVEGLEASNLPVIYMDQADLSKPDVLRKMVLEMSMSYAKESASYSSQAGALFPYGNVETTNDPKDFKNPYANNTPAPSGFVYGSSQEYYEKTTIDFNAQLKIVTPEGEYNVELKFSYTQEFYEKNETMIAMQQEQMKNPLEIELPEDDGSLQDLKSLHFVFTMIQEEEKEQKLSLIEQIKEALKERNDNGLHLGHLQNDKENENLPAFKGDFEVWQSTNSKEFTLAAAKLDGMGVFLANSKEESSYASLKANENGYSYQAGYSYSETTVASSFEEIKA